MYTGTKTGSLCTTVKGGRHTQVDLHLLVPLTLPQGTAVTLVFITKSGKRRGKREEKRDTERSSDLHRCPSASLSSLSACYGLPDPCVKPTSLCPSPCLPYQVWSCGDKSTARRGLHRVSTQSTCLTMFGRNKSPRNPSCLKIHTTKACYRGGDEVEGTVKLVLDSAVQVQGVMLRCLGSEKVAFQEDFMRFVSRVPTPVLLLLE